MGTQQLLRSVDPALYDSIQSYRFTDDKLMPWAYQHANPAGRPYHDDWGIMSSNPLLKLLQPYQKIPRIDCAYRVPLPFKQTYGKCAPTWMLWDQSYPASPDLQMETRPIWTQWGTFNLPHALVDQQVEDSGWGEFSAFINGAWKMVFWQCRRKVFGRRLAYYRGLKQDVTVTPQSDGSIKSDLMAWFPEISTTWNKEQ